MSRIARWGAQAAFFACCALMLAPAVFAQQQQRLEFPRFPGLPPMPMGAITELQTMGSSRSITMTVENGVRTIQAQDDEVKAWIQELPEGHVTIKVTRQYTRDDLDVLMEELPELYMHLKSIPTESDGAEVDVQVGVTKTYEAASIDELEKNHPDVFEIWQRFTSGSGDDLEALQDRMLIPALPALPGRPTIRGLDIDPDDIRIHPDPPMDGGEADETPPSDEGDGI
jgi:hypothetical protein